ncbi:MAG TPA: sn-glycerol-3-phosphate ABC transporter permease UgpA [Casimicrobium sp.]|nr:sn-glycerol-3-phosphate ABC transporter permease UgpA [Casimicrobium sp.]HPT57135.1 sn-glycerol-3-phosphate ABC transporter permease UgpA [Casimicrobium sp.]
MEKRVGFDSKLLPYLLIAPQIIITGVFFFWPAGQALYQSFLEQDAFGNSITFVGFKNFTALFTDSTYLESFKTTAIFSVAVAVLGLSLSLFLATQADRVIKASRWYRTILIAPYAVAPAIVGVLWMFMLSPSLGLLTHALAKIGVEWDHNLNQTQGLLLVIIAAVWKQISYNFIFFLAGLQSIPKSLIEAASIDGAGRTRRFWDIIFPLLTPTTFFLFVVNMVYAFFDTFAIIDASTKGGPGRATEILVYKVYHDGFKGLDLGSSAAQSVVLMVIVVGLTFLQFKYVERKVQY